MEFTEENYEYRGLVAKSWDFIRGDTSRFPDRQFFKQMIGQNGEPALIVGCGTGRLLLEYAADGLDVEGVDVSSEMLAICQTKARQASLSVAVYVQAMETLKLSRRFRTIIVPSSGFQLVTDIDQAASALKCFYDHLLPGGVLVASVWHIMEKGEATWGDWWLIADKDDFEEGKRLRRWERSMYDSRNQLRHTENRYELVVDEEVTYAETHLRSPEMRDYSMSQLSDMFCVAGFANVRAVSGFSNEPASEDDEVYCVIGYRHE